MRNPTEAQTAIAAFHQFLASAKAVQMAHAIDPENKVGMMYGGIFSYPNSCDPEDIAFMAVPAEEYVDMEFRAALQKQGKIHYGGGKSELIRIGAFDDIDLAVGHHTVCNTNGYLLANGTTNGFVNSPGYFCLPSGPLPGLRRYTS